MCVEKTKGEASGRKRFREENTEGTATKATSTAINRPKAQKLQQIHTSTNNSIAQKHNRNTATQQQHYITSKHRKIQKCTVATTINNKTWGTHPSAKASPKNSHTSPKKTTKITLISPIKKCRKRLYTPTVNQTKHDIHNKQYKDKLYPSKQHINRSIITAKNSLSNSDIFPASIPIKSDAGKCGLMWPRGAIANSHPAAKLLHFYSNRGCPVDTGEPWNQASIITALKRGPHISAKNPTAAKYLHEETQEKLKGGYIRIVKWKDIKHNFPKNLKISPVAMIPHKSRSFRCILDLSFKLKVNGTKINSVNETTTTQSPQKSMAQLGWVIKRIITTMAHNYNTNKPFFFSKCDIKDGFWRMNVSLDDAWNFCYVIPSQQNKASSLDDTNIVVPHALQMGWAESPPFFCAATETARDVIQQYFNSCQMIPPHPLEHHLYNRKFLHENPPDNNTITQFEVYVDDFIACTNETNRQHIQKLARSILVGIHSIFPPPHITGHPGEDPISNKKLIQQEGLFETEKEVLGWIINGNNYTIKLPQSKITKIKEEISNIIKRKTVPSNTLEKIQGRLIHASLGIPGGRGLMSPLYAAKLQAHEFTTITPQIKQCLKDWKELVNVIGQRETSVLELVPKEAEYIAYVDASKTAVGGVWTNGTETLQNQWVWRLEWPQDIQNQLVSATNRKGTLSINDLEMAGILLSWLVLEHIIPTSLQGIHVGMFCDNMSTVTWTNKKSTSTSTIAGHLLRALALRQHVNRSSPLAVVHIEGIKNKMADLASRSFLDKQLTKSNKTFLQHFKTLFPLQNNSWQEFHLPNKLTSRVISCLRGKPLAMASWTKITRPGKNIGSTGQPTQTSSELNHSWDNALNKKKLSSSQHLLLGSGQVTMAKGLLSELQQSHKRLLPYPRPLNWLENSRQSTKQRKFTKSQWHGKWKATKDVTHQPHHN